jgi:hypothetical protein
MTKGISEVVGTGEGADKSSVTVYRALRQLICAPCGGMIAEGTLFTRRSFHGQGLRILPRCQKCAPFTLSLDMETERPRSAMLDALLAPQSEPEADSCFSTSKAEGKRDAVREAVARRLGPALRRTRDR